MTNLLGHSQRIQMQPHLKYVRASAHFFADRYHAPTAYQLIGDSGSLSTSSCARMKSFELRWERWCMHAMWSGIVGACTDTRPRILLCCEWTVSFTSAIYEPRRDGEAICPAKLRIQRVGEAIQYVGVVPQAVLIDQTRPCKRMLFGMFELAQSRSVHGPDKFPILRCLFSVREALHKIPLCLRIRYNQKSRVITRHTPSSGVIISPVTSCSKDS